MADWNWATGQLTRVVHPVGKFANGDNRYRRAQFDILKWDISGTEQTYILTPPADKQDGAQESIASSVQQHENGTQFGFYRSETIIQQIHANHDTDSWTGLHSFGYV